MRALNVANERRLRRAELRRYVREPPESAVSAARAVEVLRERERAVRTLIVGEFLLWPRRWGTTRARRTLTRLLISETKPLGALTERQVRALVALLERKPS